MEKIIMNEKQAADYLGVSVSFLRLRRSTFTGTIPGPKFLKLGKTVRYRRQDLDSWVEEYIVKPEKGEVLEGGLRW